MILGAKTGARKSEWCQDSQDAKKDTFSKNIDGTSKAFIAQDFQFSYRSARQGAISIQLNKQPNVVHITWRFQKNGQNGETIPFTKDSTHPFFCPVRAASRIIQRAQRLNIPAFSPIAVFASKQNSFHFIHDKQVRTFIQHAAARVYNITSKAKLQLFSCHSIRVGACVALHVGGADPMSIKARLRWRSNSFEMYLRHVVQLGSIQNMLFNRANPDDIENPVVS